MSVSHGEIVTQKPIGEYAEYIKKLLPANIPETYALKPLFESVASQENIRNGVIAFRDFLHLFCDRLISDGHVYAKPKKTNNPADYPFLHHINHLLIDIGYHSKPAGNGDLLLVTEIPSFTAPKPKIPVSKQMECLRFLALCGFVFTGIDLDTRIFTMPEKPLEVSYPDNPVLLTGLKALSVADMELRTTRRYSNDDNLLRCDYRVMKAEETDVLDVLKDFLHPLPKKCPLYLQEKIAEGYGCDRKLRNERCQGGCQGFRIPLDDSILDIKNHIETWLINEARLH